MAISRTIQSYLSKGDLDAIEDDWLAHSEDDPKDLDYFVGVARALSGAGESDRAETLLRLLDDELKEKEQWVVRLKMLRRAGHLLDEPKQVHEGILETLSALYADQPSFEGLMEQLGLKRGVHDLKKIWEKADRLGVLITFDVGAAVFMEGKGAGRVVDVNFGLESLKIDFERLKGVMVGFRAATKLLKILPENHILYRKQEELPALKILVKGDAPELLRIVLQSYDRPLKAAEIKADLADIVTPGQWSTWWTAARKHPQVVAGAQARQTYTWADTTEDAAQVGWERYQKAEPREKIELLRRDGTRDKDLGELMVIDLSSLGVRSARKDPGLAFEIWCAIDRFSETTPDASWAPEVLLGPGSNARKVCGDIQEKALREKAYQIVRDQREDWDDLFLGILPQESDSKLLTLLADELVDVRPVELGRFCDRLVSQPHKNPPGFAWLVERAADNEDLQQRNPLILMRQFLQMLSDDTFVPFRVRLRKQVESGGLLPRLLPYLKADQAPQAKEVIERAPSLEGYQRDALMTALELRFESLRQRDEDSEPLYALPASIEAKRAEFQHLHTVELPTNRKAIEEARALGDLRENFEYKSARQRHEYLSSRLAALTRELSRAQPIELASLDNSMVRIGSVLELGGGEEPRTLTLLGPWESMPEEGVISYQSELGQTALGKRVGDRLELSGQEYEIEAIGRYVVKDS